RAVGTADPDADRTFAIEAHSPRVPISVRRAGLEGDAATGSVLGWWRTQQDAADVPGGRRIQQPARGGCFVRARAAVREWHRGAEPGQAGIERNEIVKRHPDATNSDRHPRHLAP